tara:strand:+ start:238421 stop:239176 length:756 start_codon:yes stop_codon:yes gene_type:complete
MVLCMSLCGLPQVSADENSAKLKPILAIPGRVVLEEGFSDAGMEVSKDVWLTRQGTRWAVEDGVLQGRESSAEFQAARKHHFGYEPRLSIPVTPQEFVAEFSFRFIDGEETAIVPFVEFGHHVCRIRFSREGASLIADHESLKLDESTDFVWQSGKWYHALAEMKDGQFVMQIAGGPTLAASHPSFRQPPSSGGNGIGFAGPKHGRVELDNIKIATAEDIRPDWKAAAARLGTFVPVRIKEPKPATKKKGE